MQRKRAQGEQNHKKSNWVKGRRIATDSQKDQQVLPASIQAVLDLQGTIGNRATAALLQRQNEEGSATVVGSASSEELAADNASFTQGLVGDEDIYEDPTKSLENEAITAHRFESQHPSIAQVGIRPNEIKGEKLGMYIGNKEYTNDPPWGKLPGAKADTDKMKGAMEGHEYKTLDHQEDKSAQEMGAIFKGAVNKAKSGDSLLLYYAGHGVPGGIVGVESDFKDADKKASEEEEAGDSGRGFKLTRVPIADMLTEIEPYSNVLQSLEAGVARGVHTTLIADACHSGSAADLVRDKAVEKLSKTDNNKIKATTEQVKRLEDMKEQIPERGGQSSGATRGGIVERGLTLELGEEPAAKSYWKSVVRPELQALAKYLKEAGMPISVPNVPSDYTKAGIEQPINQVINALIDLGEVLKKELEESTLEKAPG